MKRPQVLLVDDDLAEVDRLSTFLLDFGFSVQVAHDGETVQRLVANDRPDLVVMDLVLSKANGLTLMQDIRREARIPVIVASRRNDTADRIVGLELGADDYMCKPLEPRELLARIRAILRRLPERETVPAAATRGVQVGRWELRRDERRLVSADEEPVPLSASEYRLLMAFVGAPRMVLSRQQLMSSARGRDMRSLDRGIDLLVSRLRRKLEDDMSVAPLIRTVRGRGYIYEPPNAPREWIAAPPDRASAAYLAPSHRPAATQALGV